MNNVVLESITNVRTVRAYSKEEENYQKNLKYSNDAYQVEVSNLKINVVFEALFKFIVAISNLICITIGSYFYYKGYLTSVSDLAVFLMYLGLFQSPLTAIGNMINNFYQSLISADRLNEVYDSTSSVVDKDDLEITSIEKIEFKNFKFHYPNDEFNSLNNINLVINKGETIGIVGKTASGKTSLVRQLVRQLPTEDNEIFINDRPIELYNKETIRQFISYVPQEHVLFSRSVIDNVRLGKDKATQEEIDLAVKMADFNKDLENLTEGYDTIVGEYGVTLSGGQKQRLGIARAFLRNSDVLVLDDSLSAVDGTTEANIIRNLKEYRKGKTNIIVCHRLSAVAHADKIIVLDEGKIVEEGKHDDLMASQGWYYEQYTAQHFKGEVEL
jgi:ATP-binding cassette subfamily B protein